MKFTIDTEAKTITLLEEVEWDELIKTLERLLGGKLSKYTIMPKVVITEIVYYSAYPFMYPTYPVYQSYPHYPYPIITYGVVNGYALANG